MVSISSITLLLLSIGFIIHVKHVGNNLNKIDKACNNICIRLTHLEAKANYSDEEWKQIWDKFTF